VWNILEADKKFELLLVNAQHIKNVPGRKTDQKDSEWILELLQHGLLRASFVPPLEIRRLRDLTRMRAKNPANLGQFRQSNPEGVGGCQYQTGLSGE
jgi:transposase